MLSKIQSVSKEKNLLKIKRKRENFQTPKNINVPETKITLIYISKTPYNLHDFSYIKFSFSDKINLVELIKNKVQSLLFDINIDKIYVLDRIELVNEDESKKEYFVMPIYLKKKLILGILI